MKPKSTLDPILQAIYQNLEETNRQLPPTHALPLKPNTVLLGEASSLDSLDFVQFIVNLEQRLQADTGRSLSLMTDKAMSYTRSPFRTVESLHHYIRDLLNE